MKKILIFLLFFIPIFTFSQDIIKTCRVTKSCSLNEKPMPGTEVLQMRKGDLVDIVDIEGGYYKVNYKGKIGYVLDLFIYDPELISIVKERKNKEGIEIKQHEKEIRDTYRKTLVEKYGTNKADDILKGKLFPGITSDEAERSWGYPDDKNVTTYEFGVHEQWVYEGKDYKNRYLYFEDGILKTIQN